MTSTGLHRVHGPWPQRMDNPIHHYDWGSLTALAWMQGRAPTGRPEAELWMGAHPSSPSALIAADGGREPLDELVQDQGAELLGAQVQDRFGRMPFLLKVLAFDQPLSVQVHPGPDHALRAWQHHHGSTAPVQDATGAADGAGAGPGREGEADGGSANRHSYPDPYAKPEMLYALQPVDAMCGFRAAEQAHRMVELIGSPRLSGLGAGLGPSSDVPEEERLRQALAALLYWPEDDRAALAAELGERARALLATVGPRGAGVWTPPSAGR